MNTNTEKAELGLGYLKEQSWIFYANLKLKDGYTQI